MNTYVCAVLRSAMAYAPIARMLVVSIALMFFLLSAASVSAQTISAPTATLKDGSWTEFCTGTPPATIVCQDSPIYVELSANPAYEIRYTFLARDFPAHCTGWGVSSSKSYLYYNPDQPNRRIPTIEIASANNAELQTIACDRDDING